MLDQADTLDAMRPIVDATIGSLGRARFRTDPIGGEKYSRQTSIVSSAYKRHGQILEIALRHRLSQSKYFEVWHEPLFKVSDIADRAIRDRNIDIPDGSLIELPYGDAGRTLQIDAFVCDKRISSLRSGLPPLKWSTHRDMLIPFSGGSEDGWQAREARRYRAEAASG